MTAIRQRQIGRIHGLAKEACLDEETRRDIIAQVAGGKRSSKDLTAAEADDVIRRLEVLVGGGTSPSVPHSRRGIAMDGPFAGKLRALWIAGWNLGVVHDRTDEALTAFVERQTGIQAVRWLRDAVEARKAIEAVKGWLAREAGVDWSTDGGRTREANPRQRVAAAQWAYIREHANQTPAPSLADFLRRTAGDWQLAPVKATDQQWQTVQNALGTIVRTIKADFERGRAAAMKWADTADQATTAEAFAAGGPDFLKGECTDETPAYHHGWDDAIRAARRTKGAE
ncbi:Mu-like prophage protein gp16 [Hartmannibacter diazotrophicus]|uniref:Mu-like prophage protein gp16 n=1 Tax=Hartmannibacter diazotrophicus TaxID=1482074 RepID=A0A2C9D6H5_9HYPH|nr:regulatory protein GemA [Hartmannibacter diazotrophicus]SON55790.1 Mu-like prophage protein gp16 [Hartmannibacter diazotrophicus]